MAEAHMQHDTSTSVRAPKAPGYKSPSVGLLGRVANYFDNLKRKKEPAKLIRLAKLSGPDRAIEEFLNSGRVKPSLKNVIWFYDFLKSEFGLSWAVEFVRSLLIERPSRQVYEFLASGRVPKSVVREIISEQTGATQYRGVRQDGYALHLFSEICLSTRLDARALDAAWRAAASQEQMPGRDRARLSSLARAISFGPINHAWELIDPMSEPPSGGLGPARHRLVVVEPKMHGSRLQALIENAETVSLLHFDDLYGKVSLPPLRLAPGQKLNILHARSTLTRFSDEYRRVHQLSLTIAQQIVEVLLRSRAIDSFTRSRALLRSSLTLEIADKLFFHMLPRAALRHELEGEDYDQKVVAFGADQRLHKAVMSMPGITRESDILCCCPSDSIEDRINFGARLQVTGQIFTGERQLGIVTRLEKSVGLTRRQRVSLITRWVKLSHQMRRRARLRGRAIAKAAPARDDRQRVVLVTNETRAYFATAVEFGDYMSRDYDVLIAYVGGAWNTMATALRHRRSSTSPPPSQPEEHDQSFAPVEDAARVSVAAPPLPEGTADDGQAAELQPIAATFVGAGETVTEADAGDVAGEEDNAIAHGDDLSSPSGEDDASLEVADENGVDADADVADPDNADADADSDAGEADSEATDGEADDEDLKAVDADESISANEGDEGEHDSEAASEVVPTRDLQARSSGEPVALAPRAVDFRRHRFAHARDDGQWGAMALSFFAQDWIALLNRHRDNTLATATLNDLLVEICSELAPRFLSNFAAGDAFLRGIAPAALAICPGRPPQCFAFGAIARSVGTPSLTLEPHALNATYPRYTKVSTDSATVVSSYFHKEYAKNFGVPLSRCSVIGSPRLLQPVGYDSEEARSLARAKLQLGENGEAIVVFMSQPLNWEHLKDVWTIIVLAAKRYEGRLTLVVKTHPEEGPARAREYLDIAVDLGAQSFVRHIVAGPNDVIEASDIVMTCFSVLAMEARIRQRNVVIVSTPGAIYPVPYHEIVDAPLCETVEQLTDTLGRLLGAPDANREEIERFRAANMQFFDGRLPERVNAAVAETIEHGLNLDENATAEDASPFVVSEQRAFVV